MAKATLADVSEGSERRPDTGGNSNHEPVAAPGDAGGITRYRERLYTPWWWYVVALGVASLLAAEFHIAGYHLTDAIPWGILLPLSVLIVWFIGTAKLEIIDDQVRIRGESLPLGTISGAVRLGPETLRRVVGREGDPAAFVSIRPWIKPGVQLWLDDPDSTVPYWVLSTRHPEKFLAAIEDAL